ncbi:MAG TPA: DUF4038 domain-containing protein [Chthonomonadaceae bacterium]|nr:DUF4038 domain-containing protein [Chthonomonadaceae bacterium]
MNPLFLPATRQVDVYEYLQVTIRFGHPVADPFRSVQVTGILTPPSRSSGTRGRSEDLTVLGFCDSQDGSVHRIRFLPTMPGLYDYAITVHHEGDEALYAGRFEAVSARHRGLLRVDPEHPWHFLWSGTGEHFFWNATTSYLMAGNSEEGIAAAIARLAAKKINRIRVSLCPSRQKDGGRWYEPQVIPREDFTYCYGPWLSARPESVEDPGWDVTRFDVAYWQKFERLLAHARAHDMIVSVIFFTDARELQNYPFDREKIGDDPDERRYYAYAAARLAAFSNVEWCLTNEWALFRPDEWADVIGPYLSECDPYGHLMSIHGHERFPYRTSEWADFAMFQRWDEHGGYDFMLKNRQEQAATGRPMPQINEEYGYEDHYPGQWGEARAYPARSADTRRRLAWEITMAGGYQTTGESAANGLGGWINGRGDDSMTMLDGYAHLYDFFTGFDWWKLEPRPDLAHGALCLAEPGQRYIVYLPQGGSATLQAAPGSYRASWFNPRTGTTRALPDATFPGWTCPPAPDTDDWALHLERR